MDPRQELAQTIQQQHRTRELGKYDHETGERHSQVGTVGEALKAAAERVAVDQQQPRNALAEYEQRMIEQDLQDAFDELPDPDVGLHHETRPGYCPNGCGELDSTGWCPNYCTEDD